MGRMAYVILIIVVVLVIASLAGNFFMEINKKWLPAIIKDIDEKTPYVQIGNGKWEVDLATSSWQKAKGLSGRESMAEDRGMLFVFNYLKQHSFWMKGMKFSLDFVWIRSSDGDRGVVVDVTENVPPMTFSKIVYYYPSENVDLVLELNAGQIAKWRVNKGDEVSLVGL